MLGASDVFQTKCREVIAAWESIGYSEEEIIAKIQKVVTSSQVQLKLILWLSLCLFLFFF